MRKDRKLVFVSHQFQTDYPYKIDESRVNKILSEFYTPEEVKEVRVYNETIFDKWRLGVNIKPEAYNLKKSLEFHKAIKEAWKTEVRMQIDEVYNDIGDIHTIGDYT